MRWDGQLYVDADGNTLGTIKYIGAGVWTVGINGLYLTCEDSEQLAKQRVEDQFQDQSEAYYQVWGKPFGVFQRHSTASK